ncbi:hypothetical protein [Onishia taeanensis]
MTTLIVYHDVEDGERWARAWKKGPGSRHEMFARIGVSARTFKNPEHPNSVALILEVPDMARFQSFMDSDEAKQAMEEDRLRVESMRMLGEFTP